MILHLWASPDTGQQFVTAILHHGQLARLTVFESWQTTIKPSGWLEVRIRTHKGKKKGITKNEMSLWKQFRHSKITSKLHIDKESLDLLHSLMINFRVFQFITYKKCIFDRKQALEKCPSTFTLCSRPPSLEDHANGGIVKEKLLVALTKAHNWGWCYYCFFFGDFYGIWKERSRRSLVMSFMSKHKIVLFSGWKPAETQSFDSSNRTFATSKCDTRYPRSVFFPKYLLISKQVKRLYQHIFRVSLNGH